MNQIVIKGRLGKDPELKYTNSEVPVCTFTVAVDRSYTKRGEERQSDWFTCQCWRQQAEFIAKHFAKGQEILLRGEMQSRKYKDKDGNDRTVWELQVDRAEFCGSKQSGGGSGGYAPSSGGYSADVNYSDPGFDGEDEEVPF